MATEQAHKATEQAEEAARKAESARKEGMLAAAGQLEGVASVLASASTRLSDQIDPGQSRLFQNLPKDLPRQPQP